MGKIQNPDLFSFSNGLLDLLKWSHKKECSWTACTCAWESWTYSYAAQYNHFEVLKWAYEHGCPLDAESICSWLHSMVIWKC